MDKKRARRLAIFGLLLMLPMLLLGMPAADTDETNWPQEADKTAEMVSLTEVVELLKVNEDGRRAAVLGDFVYVELPAAAEPLPLPTQALVEPVETDPEITPRVVKAQMPWPSSAFVAHVAVEYPVELEVLTNAKSAATLTDRLIQILPIFLIVGLIILMFSRGAAKSLGLSTGFEIISPDKLTETFDDVAGIDNARGEIEEIVTFLKNPKEAARLGGRMPKGAIFDGPPGTGKTLLVRALAKEAGVSFMNVEAAGLNQFFVGAGAAKIKKAFREARKHAPCIVFIDEIDAMGRRRGGNGGGAGDEKETTLNALLVELDGFDPREGVFLAAATNRYDVLDPALTRRGRIDRRVTVGLPDIEGRKAMLDVHCRKIKADPDLDIATIASTTFGFSGADIAALVNEAALAATRAHPEQSHVTLEDFRVARDKLLIGISGSRRVLGKKDREITAVHEAGHALVAALLPEADPIEKATILPQGGAAGFVMQAPVEDKTFSTRAELEARIRVAVAGRMAEQAVLGDATITSGASSDIEQATTVAREMVTRYGMSAQGFVRIDPNDPLLFDPQNPPIREITKIIEAARTDVAKMLKDERAALDAITQALLARETILGADIARLIAGEDIDAEEAAPTS